MSHSFGIKISWKNLLRDRPRRVISSNKNFRSIRPCFQFIPLPTLSPFSSLGHDASLHRLVNRRKKRGDGESSTNGRKRVSEKGVLGTGTSKALPRGWPATGWSTPVRKVHPSLPPASLLMLPLYFFLSLLAPLPTPLSELPRENPPPFVKGDPTKSPESYTCVQKGWRGWSEGRERKREVVRDMIVGDDGRPGTTRQTRRACTHLALYIANTAENPLKGSTRETKTHSSLAPHSVHPSSLSPFLPSFSLRSSNVSLCLFHLTFLFIIFANVCLLSYLIFSK